MCGGNYSTNTPIIYYPKKSEVNVSFCMRRACTQTTNFNQRIHVNYFKTLEYPSYSPDLTPSDYYMSLKMKQGLKLQIFSSSKKVTDFASKFFFQTNLKLFNEKNDML